MGRGSCQEIESSSLNWGRRQILNSLTWLPVDWIPAICMYYCELDEFARGSSWIQATVQLVRLKDGHNPNFRAWRHLHGTLGWMLPPGAAQRRGARVRLRSSKQNLLENSCSEFVEPLGKGLLKISPLGPAVRIKPSPISAASHRHWEPQKWGSHQGCGHCRLRSVSSGVNMENLEQL